MKLYDALRLHNPVEEQLTLDLNLRSLTPNNKNVNAGNERQYVFEMVICASLSFIVAYISSFFFSFRGVSPINCTSGCIRYPINYTSDCVRYLTCIDIHVRYLNKFGSSDSTHGLGLLYEKHSISVNMCQLNPSSYQFQKIVQFSSTVRWTLALNYFSRFLDPVLKSIVLTCSAETVSRV